MTELTYPTKKMSIEEYREEKQRQFGNVFPSIEAKCHYCRKKYGEHYGLECPKGDK